MKGVHPFIAATILILVTVVLATLVSSFVVNVSSERSKVILNATQTKLSCQYAGLLVTNVTYNCNSACFTGSPYTVNATIENTGSSRVVVSNLFITLADGTSYMIDGNLSSLSAGDITTKLFDAIRINTSSKIPAETMDIRSAYVNGTNTIGLWHFDDASGNTTADAARGNTGTLKNGTTTCNNSTNQCPLWNTTSLFGYAITFDGINDYVLLDSRNFSNVSGTVEAWINMQNNNPSNNYTIFSTPSEISSGDDGLVGLWHFSQNSTASGGVKDSTPFGNNGTANNTPMFTNEGRFQTAWQFDGINDFIDAGYSASLNITGNITVAAWLKVNRIDGLQHFTLAKASSWSLGGPRADSNRTSIEIYTANGDDGCYGATPTANRWHHIALTYNGSVGILYFDGIENCTVSGTIGGAIDSNSNIVEIGRKGGGSEFNGTIDEVAIYNRSLSAAEIRDKYLGGLSMHKMGDNLRFVAGNVSLSYNISSWTGWHHAAGTYTSTAAALYADGASVNASSNRGLVILGNNSYIGGLNGTISFNGTIDELRISNMSRVFNATLQYNVTLLNISAVRVYNSTNALINASTSLGGVNRYNKTLADLPISEYRVEVDTTDGNMLEKWYPYRTGGSCSSTSTLDKVAFSTANCPEVTDTYYGSDVTFVGCVT
ncbi:MAG: laminin G domain-containing protein [Candidatus Aenigmarchaeota archaeon]|nr:laminin G domain-containing protein [Candidatus Aenigmarchaeota archaeon]